MDTSYIQNLFILKFKDIGNLFQIFKDMTTAGKRTL